MGKTDAEAWRPLLPLLQLISGFAGGKYTSSLDEFVDLFVVVVEGEDEGAEFLQKVFCTRELDPEFAGLEVDAGGEIGEAAAYEIEGGLVAGNLQVFAGGILSDAVEVLLDAAAAGDLGGEALLERPQLLDEILAPADQAAAGAVLGAAALEDAPGGPFADPENLFERPAADPVGGHGAESGGAFCQFVGVQGVRPKVMLMYLLSERNQLG